MIFYTFVELGSTSSSYLNVCKDKTVRDLPKGHVFILPNPHTKRLTYFNSIVEEIYNSAHQQLGSGFDKYLAQQQQFRWGVHQDLTAISTTVKSYENGKDGVSQNIIRYQGLPSDVNDSDVHRSKATLQILRGSESKISALLAKLCGRKKYLYKPTNELYPWASSKLKFVDDSQETLRRQSDKIMHWTNEVSHTAGLLKKRFSKIDSDVAKSKKRKASKDNDNLLQKLAYKLVRDSHGKEIADEVIKVKNGKFLYGAKSEKSFNQRN